MSSQTVQEQAMGQNKYVIVLNDGTSHDLSRREKFTETTFDLADLLDQGWRPVHETAMGRIPYYDANGGDLGEFTAVLILLVKD